MWCKYTSQSSHILTLACSSRPLYPPLWPLSTHAPTTPHSCSFLFIPGDLRVSAAAPAHPGHRSAGGRGDDHGALRYVNRLCSTVLLGGRTMGVTRREQAIRLPNDGDAPCTVYMPTHLHVTVLTVGYPLPWEPKHLFWHRALPRRGDTPPSSCYSWRAGRGENENAGR